MNKKLILVGYWHSFFEPQYPDPAWFVDEAWDRHERELVSLYLKLSNEMPYAYMGISWCRFRCGEHGMGSLEYTDGHYVWPEGFVHYINHHGVKPPQEMINHILSRKIPDTSKLEKFKVDETWWKTQKGWNISQRSYNDMNDIGILILSQTHQTSIEKQEFLLKDFLRDAYGVKGKLHFIDKVLSGEEAHIKGRFIHVNSFLEKIIPYGLNGSFTYLTKEEYGD